MWSRCINFTASLSDGGGRAVHDVQAFKEHQVHEQLARRVQNDAASQSRSHQHRPKTTVNGNETHQSQIEALQRLAARAGPDPTTMMSATNTNRTLRGPARVSGAFYLPPSKTDETASKARVRICTEDMLVFRRHAEIRCVNSVRRQPNRSMKAVDYHGHSKLGVRLGRSILSGRTCEVSRPQ